MSGANIFASIAIGFCGGSLVRVFTGPVIEIPNFTQEEPPPQRLVFIPKEINGETQYVLTRVEDGSVHHTLLLSRWSKHTTTDPLMVGP